MANTTVQTGNSLPANCRSTKSTSSSLVGTIVNGTTVDTVRCDGEWGTLPLNGTPCFMQHRMLVGIPTTNGDGLTVNNTAKLNTGAVNVRTGAGQSYSTTGSQLGLGTAVTIYAKTLNSSEGFYWYRINPTTESTARWVRGDFLAPGGSGGSSGGGGTTPPPGSDFYQATVDKTGVNIRKLADANANTWGQIDQNRRIIVKPHNNDWYITFWGNNPGSAAYIKADCVTLGAKNNDLRSRVLWLAPHFVGKKKWYFGGNLNTQTDGLSGDWCMSFCNWIYTAAGGTTSTAPLNDSNAYTSWTWFGNNSRDRTSPTEGDIIGSA